jgi:hypothetical protein
MNSSLENELGSFRVEHLPDLEKFDLSSCSPNEAIFFQLFNNKSFPELFKIYFSREDSRYQIDQINKDTGTPTPWTSYFEVLFIGQSNLVGQIYESIAKFKVSDRTYAGDEDDIFNAIELEEIHDLHNESLRENGYAGLNGVLILNDGTKEINGQVGFVYCMVNPDSPNICKIGMTNRDPRIRAAELTLRSKLPNAYQPIFSLICTNALAVEQKMHQEMSNLSAGKEYFYIDEKKIVDIFLSQIDSNEIPFGLQIHSESKLFSQDINSLIADRFESKRDEQYAAFKLSIAEKCQKLYQSQFVKMAGPNLFSLRYGVREKLLNDKLTLLNHDKEVIEAAINKHGDKQKDLLKGGGLLSGLSVAAFDGGMSLVPVALTAAGVYFNKKKNNDKKEVLKEIEEGIKSTQDELSALEKNRLKDLLHTSIHFTGLVGKAAEIFSNENYLVGFNISVNEKASGKFICNLVGLSVQTKFTGKYARSADQFLHLKLSVGSIGGENYKPYDNTLVLSKESQDNIDIVEFIKNFCSKKNLKNILE